MDNKNLIPESQFDITLNQILESLELIMEKKYAIWVDQKGRKVYPGVLSIKQMKKVLPRRLGFCQKNGHIYSLPLIPSKGKIQKEFKKYYAKSFMTRPHF